MSYDYAENLARSDKEPAVRRVRDAHQPVTSRSERPLCVGVQGDGSILVPGHASDVCQAFDGITPGERVVAEFLVESEANPIAFGCVIVLTHEPMYVADPQATDRFTIRAGLP